MSTMIGGVTREVSNTPDYDRKEKKVGLFEANVIAINPTGEELNELLGKSSDEEVKTINYIDTSPAGNNRLRIDVWLEEIKTGDKFKMPMWIEDKVKRTSDGLRKQYLNQVGYSAWAQDEEGLSAKFRRGEIRECHIGEEIFYNFLRTWLGKLNYSSEETTLVVAFNKLMRNSIEEVKDLVGGEWCTPIIAMATIQTKEKDGEVRQYQNVYGKGVLPAYELKKFRLVDYHNPEVLRGIQQKDQRDLSPVERFVKEATGQYGCRDYYRFRDIEIYDPEKDVAASDKVISDDGADY